MDINKLVSFHEHHCQCYLREYVEKAGFTICPCATLRVTKLYDPGMYEEVKSILLDIAQTSGGTDEKLAMFCERVTAVEVEAHAKLDDEWMTND